MFCYPSFLPQETSRPPTLTPARSPRFFQAVTGSGKTLAFLIPLVQRLLRIPEPTKRHHISAIIVSPTRELASQIHAVLLSLLHFHPPSAQLLPCLAGSDKRPATTEAVVVPQLLVGGTTKPAEDLSFFLRHSPNLIISSPGRLVELLSSPHVHCPQSVFDMLVLDEADRLLDLGFKQDLQSIVSRLPKQRRTGLFSASVSEAVGEIIRVGLRNPVKIEVRVKMKDGQLVEDRKTPASLRMKYLVTPASHKLPALCQLLSRLPQPPQRSIVFLSTCAAVDYFQHLLPALLPPAFSLIPLHGKHPAKVREKNFGRFLTSVSPTILLTTDLAARGLDIPQVDLVVQIDAPSDPKAFIHRSGRAGRAGRKGLAVVFLQPGSEEDYVRFLEIRKTPIQPLDKPEVQVSTEDAQAATQTMRNLVQADRALFDKAQKAFVSWVRSYSAHHATSIFRLGDLDWADLAEAWALFRMPRMPELRSWQGDPMLGLALDWDAYRYQDAGREKTRLAALAPDAAPPPNKAARTKATANMAWSAKLDRLQLRSARRQKRQRRRDAIRDAHMTPDDRRRKLQLDALVTQVRQANEQVRQRDASAPPAKPGDTNSRHHDGCFDGFSD